MSHILGATLLGGGGWRGDRVMSPSNQKLSLGAKSPVTWLLGRVLACDQATQSALAAGREREGELATTSLEFEFHLYIPCGSPSTELSDCRQSARSGTSTNVNNHWKIHTKDNDIISNVISANHYVALTFLMQIFKFQRRSCKLSFLYSPTARASRRACSQARKGFSTVFRLLLTSIHSGLMCGQGKLFKSCTLLATNVQRNKHFILSTNCT